MPKITIFVLNSNESWEKSVRYKRVNRNTVRFKGSAAYNRQFNGLRDAFRILLSVVQFILRDYEYIIRRTKGPPSPTDTHTLESVRMFPRNLAKVGSS